MVVHVRVADARVDLDIVRYAERAQVLLQPSTLRGVALVEFTESGDDRAYAAKLLGRVWGIAVVGRANLQATARGEEDREATPQTEARNPDPRAVDLGLCRQEVLLNLTGLATLSSRSVIHRQVLAHEHVSH